MVTVEVTSAIPAGQTSETFTFTVDPADLVDGLSLDVSPSNSIPECDEDNNADVWGAAICD